MKWWQKLKGSQATLLAAVIAIIPTTIGSSVTFLMAHLPNYYASPSNDFKNLVNEARAAKKPYVLENVTMYVQMEKTGEGKKAEITSNIRDIYTVHALRNITNQDHVFSEQYTTAHAYKVERWYGPQTEHDSGNGPGVNIYDVLFNLSTGQNETIVTGANYFYHLPFSENRMDFDSQITILPNEEMVFYPNDDDYIYELDIIVESKTLNLKPLVGGAVLREENGKLSNSDITFNNPDLASKDQVCLMARWYMVKPNSKVGLHFRWE